MDLRVRRTRKMLWDALLALLAEKPFTELTVEEICARAMVNRTTFYKHYRDKHDLAVRGAEAMLAALGAKLEGAPDETAPQAPAGTPPEHISALFAHVAAEPAFFRLAFCGDDTLPFRAIMERMIADRTRRRVAALNRSPGDHVPDEVVAVFGAGALVSVLSWWVSHDFPLPPETMARHVTYLLTRGSHQAAGAASPAAGRPGR